MIASAPLPITSLAAIPLALLFSVLSARVILARRSRSVAFGTGSDPDLERRVRAHANFAEHVPLALVLLALAELRGAAAIGLAVSAGALLVGRFAHAIGVSSPARDGILRVVGVAGTQTSLGLSALLLAASFA